MPLDANEKLVIEANRSGSKGWTQDQFEMEVLAAIPGGTTIDVEDEGVSIGAASTLNFTGAGVTASGAGSTKQIAIPAWDVYVFDEGTPLPTNFINLDFVGDGVTASGTGSTKTISIPGLTVDDEGTPLATNAEILNFTGVGVTASGTGTTKTINVPGLIVQDESTPLTQNAQTLNFTGVGVTASGASTTKVVNVPGLTVQDEGTPLTSEADTLNFTGAGISASGSGTTKTVNVPGLIVQDEGTPLATEANTLNFVGDGVTASGTGSTKTITIPDVSYAKIIDQKAQGTSGGSYTGGTTVTRDLNTIVQDADSIISSLSANQFTLGAGNYEFLCRVTGYKNDAVIAWLEDITNTIDYYGENAFTANGGHIFISGRFTLTASAIFRIRFLGNSNDGDGLGRANNFTGIPERYTSVEIWKLP